MVSHLFVSQLVLVALVWLCVMLHWAWPSDPATACPTTLQLTPPLPKRDREPKPCAGLTTNPHCDACAHVSALRPHATSAPPPRIIMTRGRRQPVDTSTHFCPNPDCAYRGWVGWGKLRANGHPSGGPWRQLLCIAGRGYFLAPLGTLLYGNHTSVELIVRVLACLAEGLGIRGTARVFEVAPDPVLHWLVEAAEQLRAFSRHVLHDVRVRQVQLDALFALLSAVKAGEVSSTEAIARLERAPQWVWVAMDPEKKLLLAIAVGHRTLVMAQRVVHHVAQVLAPDCAPLFLPEGFRAYLTALLTHYGHWRPLPQLLYAQVVKTVRRRRLVRVRHRVVFGTLETVNAGLAPLGCQINTAFIERLNLSRRQPVAAVGRRVTTRCKDEDGLRQQLALYHVSYKFCLPPTRLRPPVPPPVPTHGTGSATQWRPCTPAMAAGLPDHVWTLREVRLSRVPPWPQPAGV